MFLFASKKAGNSFRRHIGQANKGETIEREKQQRQGKRGVENGKGGGGGEGRDRFSLFSPFPLPYSPYRRAPSKSLEWKFKIAGRVTCGVG